MARHADATVLGRRRGFVIIGLVLALVAGAVGGTVAWLSRSPAPATAALGCEPVDLTIAAAPEIAPVVTTAVGGIGDDCVRYAVRSAKSPAVLADIARGTAPDVWVPDSSMWATAVAADAGGPWTAGDSLAQSPIAIAAAASGTGALQKAPSSWAHYVNVSGDIVMANPDSDTVSRLAYLASREGASAALTQDVAGRLIFMSRYAASSTDDLFNGFLAGRSTSTFPASQQAIAAFNATDPATRLTAVFPAAGTLSLDYPWTTRPDLDAAKAAAAAAALARLQDATALQALADAGFTVTGASASGGADAPVAPKAMKPPGAGAAEVAIAQWDLLRTDMRMLAVIDVSGSMRYPAKGTGNLTRAEVTKEASIAALRILPAGSQIGSWIFSTRQGPGKQDWRELVPIARLDSKVGSGTQRDRLVRETSRLPTLLGGDTGLYDTALAAYLHMRDTYDGGYVNSVVIMTDGQNDDTDGGISLQQLLSRLAKAHDPKRPVRIITIGMGEADPKALKRIAAATGGTSYIANTADALQRVFVQALLARTKDIPTPAS